MRELTLILKKHTIICMFFSLSVFSAFNAQAQGGLSNGKVNGDFGFNGMYYIPDSTIGAEKVDSKVRANAHLNVNYTLGNFSAGIRYEYYQYPLIDMEKIGYKGQGFTHYYADYKTDFIQVTAGSFYEQFGNGLVFRAYEDRQLGVDNSLLGARIKVTPYKGIYIKGVWGVERKNFDFDYKDRNDYVRGLDAEFNLGEIFPKISEKMFILNIGGSFVSKYEKSTTDHYFTIHSDDEELKESAIIPADKIPQNVAAWATRMQFGYKSFILEGEYARKINDPNLSNDYIYKEGEAFFLSAIYSRKGMGISASFIRSDNMDYRSQRMESENSLLQLNYIPAINRQYSYQLLGNYAYASQPNGQIGAQLQFNYQIPKKSKIGGKYGTDITLNYARFHSIAQDTVPLALENGTTTGTEGYGSPFFKFGSDLLYQDIGIEISRRLSKNWKMILAYNYITYNLEILQGHEEMFHGHNVALDVTYKINSKNALRLEAQHLGSKDDYGDWVYALLEYSFNPHWIFSVGDQWNYGNADENQRLHYYNVSAAYVIGTTRIAAHFGKTREGILCIGGVCREVPASYGFGLSVTTSF
ncbi:DUF6029 family protein [Bacteroidales bacterium OttesenSCG-928-B11]|nr:DUF6029 family protein [Bacteroidales bacterium OttesenSCG-928-B11]